MTAAVAQDPEQASTPRRLGGWLHSVVPYALSILVALVIGAGLIAWAGENPLNVYKIVVTESLFERTGWRDTLNRATPLILIGLGLAVGFRASVWNIGAEGQLIAGAVMAVAVLGIVSPPSFIAIAMGLVLGAIGGAAWAAIAALLIARYEVNDVIATLLLTFAAIPLLNWLVREPLQDPASFLPQSRTIGSAELPDIPWIDTHIGVIFALIAVIVMTWLMRRTRFGFIVRAHGFNRTAVYANESRRSSVTTGILLLSGAFAGIAGYVVLAGEQIRVGGGTATGLGFTAIIVAILGRNRPIGVLVAAIGLSALLVGAEAAQRETGLPVTLMQSVQALIVICVITGDAIGQRRQRAAARRAS
jgi:simple sugar transport system permease protein